MTKIIIGTTPTITYKFKVVANLFTAWKKVTTE